MPVFSLAPAIALYYGSSIAESVHFTESSIEYHFSPVSLKLVNKIHEDYLKPIKSEFKYESGEENSALSVILEQNFINGFIANFVKIDKMYSLRDFLSNDPRLSIFKQLLTSTTVGMALPSFKEEYGEGKPLDLLGTLS